MPKDWPCFAMDGECCGEKENGRNQSKDGLFSVQTRLRWRGNITGRGGRGIECDVDCCAEGSDGNDNR